MAFDCVQPFVKFAFPQFISFAPSDVLVTRKEEQKSSFTTSLFSRVANTIHVKARLVEQADRTPLVGQIDPGHRESSVLEPTQAACKLLLLHFEIRDDRPSIEVDVFRSLVAQIYRLRL
jgi:hypothetical protein